MKGRPFESEEDEDLLACTLALLMEGTDKFPADLRMGIAAEILKRLVPEAIGMEIVIPSKEGGENGIDGAAYEERLLQRMQEAP